MKEDCLKIVMLVVLFVCFVNWVIIKDFQNLLLGWVAKRLMSSYKHCKILSFQSSAKYALWDIELEIAGELNVILFFQYSEHLSCWVSGSQFIVKCRQMTSQKIRLYKRVSSILKLLLIVFRNPLDVLFFVLYFLTELCWPVREIN